MHVMPGQVHVGFSLAGSSRTCQWSRSPTKLARAGVAVPGFGLPGCETALAFLGGVFKCSSRTTLSISPDREHFPARPMLTRPVYTQKPS